MKNYVISTLLLAMGLILHSAVPSLFGMKFDLLLVFMILTIVLFPTLKNALLSGITGGILTALTTTFPGGQLPNLIDKIITALLILLLYQLLSKLPNERLRILLLGFAGTIISGSIFLSCALLIVGLPAPFSVLFIGVVLPTAVGNTFIILVVYKACRIALGKKTIQP